MTKRIPESTVRRLSHYLRSLEDFAPEHSGTVSSEELVRELRSRGVALADEEIARLANSCASSCI